MQHPVDMATDKCVFFSIEMSRFGRVQSAAVSDVCSHHSVHVQSLKVDHFTHEALRLDSLSGKTIRLFMFLLVNLKKT